MPLDAIVAQLNLPSEVSRRVWRLSGSRLFKTQAGASFTEFRARQCHERALRLLEGDLLLSQVGERAGFGSYARFHRTFCAHQGQNLARFRRGRNGWKSLKMPKPGLR